MHAAILYVTLVSLKLIRSSSDLRHFKGVVAKSSNSKRYAGSIKGRTMKTNSPLFFTFSHKMTVDETVSEKVQNPKVTSSVKSTDPTDSDEDTRKAIEHSLVRKIDLR